MTAEPYSDEDIAQRILDQPSPAEKDEISRQILDLLPDEPAAALQVMAVTYGLVAQSIGVSKGYALELAGDAYDAVNQFLRPTKPQ